MVKLMKTIKLLAVVLALISQAANAQYITGDSSYVESAAFIVTKVDSATGDKTIEFTPECESCPAYLIVEPETGVFYPNNDTNFLSSTLILNGRYQTHSLSYSRRSLRVYAIRMSEL